VCHTLTKIGFKVRAERAARSKVCDNESGNDNRMCVWAVRMCYAINLAEYG